MAQYPLGHSIWQVVTDDTPNGTLDINIDGVFITAWPHVTPLDQGALVTPLVGEMLFDDLDDPANRPTPGAGPQVMGTVAIYGHDGIAAGTPQNYDITVTGGAVPVMSGVVGSPTGANAVDVAMTTNTGDGDIVWGLYLASATDPDRAQLRAGNNGDNVALVATGTFNPTAPGTFTSSLTGIAAGDYQLAAQHDAAGGGQSSVVVSTPFTITAPASIPDAVDGLVPGGSTACGRTSLNTLKTLGQLPAGQVSLGSSGNRSKITFTADDVTLEDFDLTDVFVDFNNRQNCLVTQSPFLYTAAPTTYDPMIRIPPGSHNCTVSYCDLTGFDGPSSRDKKLIEQTYTGSLATAAVATNTILERLRFKWYHADSVHLRGGGAILRWSHIGFPRQYGADTKVYSGVPGQYTTGDVVAFQYGGAGNWYAAKCLSAVPTTGPINGTVTADWDAKNVPHTDMLNIRGAFGAGVDVDSVYFDDDWHHWLVTLGQQYRAGTINNIIRVTANNNEKANVLFNRIRIRNIRSTRRNVLASIPIQLTSTNMNGPVDFENCRIGLNAGGGYHAGNVAKIGLWTGMTDANSGNPLPRP